MPRLLSLIAILVPAVATAAPPVTAVAYSSDGKYLAVGLPGEVRLFTADGNAVGTPEAVAGRVTALAFHPTERRLAIAHGEAGKSGLVRLRAIGGSGSEPKVAIEAHRDAIYTIAFSSDSKSLATAGYDRVVHVWDVPTGAQFAKAPRLTLKDHSDTIYAIAFNHDGTLLASGSADRSVKVWDAATGKRLYTLSDSADWVYCLAWSPDKKHLAAGGVDKSVRVWEANKDGGKLVLSAFAHEKPVWRLAYTADAKTLYTVGEDRVIKVWDAAKLAETKVLLTQPDVVLDLAVRPDGKQLAVARFDGALALLDPSGKVTAQPLPAKPAPKGTGVIPAGATEPQPPKAVAPKAERFTPNGGRRGEKLKVVVTGASLDQVKKVTANSPDVVVQLDAATAKPDRVTFDVEIKPTASIGAVQLTFEGDGGKSAPVAFAVDRFAAVAEAGVTDSARAAQTVTLPTTVVGSIDRAGDVDYFRFEAKAGDQVGVQVVATELGSKLDAVLVLADAGGVVLAEGNASLGLVIPRAGTYAVGLRDKDFRGGGDFSYRLHVGTVPVVTGVFPLAVPRGRTTDVHIEGVHLGSMGGVPTKVTVPTDAAIGSRVNVPVPAGAEKPLGTLSVMVAEFPSVVVDPVAGAEVRVPGSADGILTKPNESQLTRFAAKKGEKLVVEVLARRAGSPVDPVIEILDGSGKPVQRAVLRATAKTYVAFRDHDSTTPGIRMELWNELAIDDYLLLDGEVMKILALPKNPDDDCQFYQVGGQRLGFLGTTPSHHAQGIPMYKVEVHPPGATFPPNGQPLFPIHYRNDDGGPGFGKDSFLTFDAPADGTYQVRVTDARGASGPAHSYRVTVRPPKPDFSVSFSPTAPAVAKGQAVSLGVTVNRVDGFDGEVRVQLEGLPAGFAAPATFVEAGHTTTALALSAGAETAVPAQTKLKLVARATIAGKEVVREATGGLPTLGSLGDIVTRTRVSAIAIKPGQETKFVVDVERQGKFTGRVPVEVRGLPHGVRVMNIGLNGILITERESSREVMLYAEPWVKPMAHPIVVLARSEGKGTEHVAPSVLLKVEK